MALTYASQGATELTNNLSSAANKWWSRNFIPSAVRNNGILYGMGLIAGGPKLSPNLGNQFQMFNSLDGYQLVVRHMGETSTFTGVADANQFDAVTLSENTNIFGGMLFDWAHYYFHHPMGSMSKYIINGDSARTMSWVEDNMKYVLESWLDTLDTAIMSATAPSRSAVGGLRDAVSNTGSYGGVNRATAGNEGFASYQTTSTNLTLDDVDDCIYEAVKKGGRPKLAVGGKTPHKKINQELRGYVLYNDNDWDRFANADRVHFKGIAFIYDHKGSDTDLFILDPRGLRLYIDKLASNKLIDIPDAKGAQTVLVSDVAAQFVVGAGGWQARVDGIVS